MNTYNRFQESLNYLSVSSFNENHIYLTILFLFFRFFIILFSVPRTFIYGVLLIKVSTWSNFMEFPSKYPQLNIMIVRFRAQLFEIHIREIAKETHARTHRVYESRRQKDTMDNAKISPRRLFFSFADAALPKIHSSVCEAHGPFGQLRTASRVAQVSPTPWICDLLSEWGLFLRSSVLMSLPPLRQTSVVPRADCSS